MNKSFSDISSSGNALTGSASTGSGLSTSKKAPGSTSTAPKDADVVTLSRKNWQSDTPLLVSIIINNYNYARFLPDAIESALAQSYPWVEVLVVDDGSSDNSHAVIHAFGERVIPIFKENGGQASALNAGFARSRGSIVLFLDADDMLHTTLVERVVESFQNDANVVRVQFRLEIVDAAGQPAGLCKPPRHIAIPMGDLREQVLLYGDDMSWLPTSGNAFSAAVLREIFPIPDLPYKLCADYYLSNLSPLFGLLATLDEPGAYYRIHGANNHEKAQIDLRKVRQLIIRTQQTHGYLYDHALQLGLIAATEKTTRGKSTGEKITIGDKANVAGIAGLSLTFLANRLISLRLEPLLHPLQADSRAKLVRQGVRAAWRRSDLSLLLRLMYTFWFVAAATAPEKVVRWISEFLFYPESRGEWFNSFFSHLRRVRPVLQSQYRATK